MSAAGGGTGSVGRLSIVFVVPRFHTNLFFAVKSLVQAGHRVTLLCTSRGAAEDQSVLTPTYLDPGLSLRSAWKLLADLDPDLLFIRDVDGISMPIFLAGLLQRRRMFAYDQHPLYRRRSLRKLVTDLRHGRPIRRMTPVLGLDRSRDPDRHAVYLPFPVEGPADPVETRAYAPDGTVRILCVGKLAQKRKNQRILIDALASLPPEADFSLTLVGSSDANIGGGSGDYAASLYEAARSGSLAGRITIRADVPFAEMPTVYAGHDVCVLPSSAEPLGTSPLEGMAFGCVPIVSDQCGSAGYVPDGEHGAIVKAGDVASLRDALATVVADHDRLARIGRNAMRLARSEFGPARFVERIEALAQAK